MADHQLIVVGAGAMGAASAWHASQQVDDVLILDKGQACSGTSPRGAGLVHRLLWDPLDVGLVDRSMDQFRALAEAQGPGFTYHDPGGLLIAPGSQARRLEHLKRIWHAQGVEVLELIDHDEIAALPGGEHLTVGPDERVYLVEDDGWCVTTDAVQAMLDQARAQGATLRTHTAVDRVEDGAIVLDDGQRLTAEAIVVAAGVWTPDLLEELWPVPLQAYRPQAAVLELEHPDGLPIVHDAAHGTYWRPEGPGKLLVGDGTVLSPQIPDDDPPVEPGFTRALAEKLSARWPTAGQAGLVRAWAGYEAATPDRRPLLGPVPGTQQTFVCTGGNGFGFMRSPALGEAAACLALGEPAPLPVQDLAPDRLEPAGVEGFEPQEGFALPG